MLHVYGQRCHLSMLYLHFSLDEIADFNAWRVYGLINKNNKYNHTPIYHNPYTYPYLYFKMSLHTTCQLQLNVNVWIQL